jgi:hypothetical protein
LADHFLVHYRHNHCVIVSKDSKGSHHEKHKSYYSRESAVAAMQKDPYCHNKS